MPSASSASLLPDRTPKRVWSHHWRGRASGGPRRPHVRRRFAFPARRAVCFAAAAFAGVSFAADSPADDFFAADSAAAVFFAAAFFVAAFEPCFAARPSPW